MEESKTAYVLKTPTIHHLNTLIDHLMQISNGYGTIEIVFEAGIPKIINMTARTKTGYQYS